MMNRLILSAAIVASLAASGCCSGGSKSSEPSAVAEKPTTTAKPQPTSHAAQQPAQAAPPDGHAAAPSGYAPDGLPADIPSARSKVPTIAEWDAVPREINVARSTPLGCETKMVREWARISCRGKNNTGGAPTNVVAKDTNGQDAYLFAKGGIASLVVPVLRNKSYSALFSWSDKSQLLVVSWPPGVSRPLIKFEDPLPVLAAGARLPNRLITAGLLAQALSSRRFSTRRFVR